ncbi:MAG TPA: DUF402 domain-containing protein [Ktedonobacteraceae bacterium]|nr:DUF402 domain-containing protein [Ktedonobacteraceae bacterium]
MRTRFADRPDWQRVLAKRFAVKRIDTPQYHGYVTLLRFDEVTEPLNVIFDQQYVCIVDRGYTWLQHFPDGAHYVLLAAFDTRGDLVQWYIDIVGSISVDERGIPCYHDLYLDIVISPEGEALLLDVDELDEALRKKEVSQDEYNFAWREASTLLTALEEDMFPLLWLSEMHREYLEEELEANNKSG